MKNIATNYDYLNGLSKKTRKFIISRIENGVTVGGVTDKKNLYHSVMANMNALVKSGKLPSEEEFKDYYFSKNKERHFLNEDDQPLIDELASYCFKKFTQNDLTKKAIYRAEKKKKLKFKTKPKKKRKNKRTLIK